jgi:hypothetical protein
MKLIVKLAKKWSGSLLATAMILVAGKSAVTVLKAQVPDGYIMGVCLGEGTECSYTANCSASGSSNYDKMCGCVANACTTLDNPWC